MKKIIGLSGSLRKGSYNTALLRSASKLAPAGVELEVWTVHGIPLYNEDEEAAAGIPAAVTKLKDAIASAQGLLLVTPEYNNSIPGVFKNAVDWLTRPPEDIGRVFGGKPVAVIGASPGGLGTTLSQAAWLPVLRTLGTKPWWEGRLIVSRAAKAFNGDGQLVDEKVKAQLKAFVEGFAASLG